MHFVLRCIDRTDRPGLRQQVRPVHLAHLTALGSRIVLAGPLLGPDEAPIGSLLVVEAPDLAAAEALAAADPYAREGLFAEVTVTPFRLVFLNPPQA